MGDLTEKLRLQISDGKMKKAGNIWPSNTWNEWDGAEYHATAMLET